MTNNHNTNALLLGTAEFSFADGALTLDDARVIGFRDFGNMTAFSCQPSTTKVEHKGSYRGTKRIDRTRITDTKLLYQLKLDEWTLQNLLFVFYGEHGVSFTQTVQTTVAVDDMGFTSGDPSKIGYWYDLCKSGIRVRSITSFAWGTKVAGTDYELDPDLGRIRFMAPVSDTFTATLSAPAIVASDPKSLKAITPMLTAKRSGIARLVVFDDNSANKVALEHDAFGCDITLTGNVDGGGDAFGEFTIEVLVTSPTGTVLVREVAGGTVVA